MLEQQSGIDAAELTMLRWFVSRHDFTGCGKSPLQGGEQVSGHDLGRAERSLLRVKDVETNNSLLPQAGAEVPVLDRSALRNSFFRKLFTRAAKLVI
jgi:hypothetical protein